jgi:hypothetical protein
VAAGTAHATVSERWLPPIQPSLAAMSSDWCLARRVAAVHTTRPAAESEPAPALLAVVSVEPLAESLCDDVLFAAGQPNRSDLETVPQPPGDAMSDRDTVLQLPSKLAC